MATAQEHRTDGERRVVATVPETRYEQWTQWPVYWSAIWVGALASLATMMIFGLSGVAVGAYLVEPEQRWVEVRNLGVITLICAVLSAFFAFVIGGWVAGKIGGILRSETAMLHGAVVWLVATPLVVGLAGMGAGGVFGAWYAGLGGPDMDATTPYQQPLLPGPNASQTELEQYQKDRQAYQERVATWRSDTPKVARNSALGAVTALLLGLVGSVVGGWMASGEPMTFTYHRTRLAGTSRVAGERVQV